MQQLGIKLLFFLIASFLISGCAMFQYGNDPNYTLCKTLQSEIQFGSNSSYSQFGNTTYTRADPGVDVEKRRLQATYDKLNCSQYQLLKF